MKPHTLVHFCLNPKGKPSTPAGSYRSTSRDSWHVLRNGFLGKWVYWCCVFAASARRSSCLFGRTPAGHRRQLAHQNALRPRVIPLGFGARLRGRHCKQLLQVLILLKLLFGIDLASVFQNRDMTSILSWTTLSSGRTRIGLPLAGQTKL